MTSYFNVVYEDIPSFELIKVIFDQHPRDFKVDRSFTKGGFGYIKKNIMSFNQASATTPFLVITDLDQLSCPAELINQWFRYPKHTNLLLTIAVREIESWIMADKEGFSDFFSLRSNIAVDVESIGNPKKYLLNIINQKSRKAILKREMLPVGNAQVGRGYNATLIKFIRNQWSLLRARENSCSVNRLYDRLTEYSFIG